MNRFILLSFDIEEFDIPEEYGCIVNNKNKFTISHQGLISIISLLESLDITATFFVTANFAIHHENLIYQLAQKHEIASHGFYHSSFVISDLAKSKTTLEEITKKPVKGYRMARLANIDETEIKNAGYEYNSSMNPTYIPGRYNNFFKPRIPYYSHHLLNIPVSVTPLIRFPLFWLSFKNFPLFLIKLASLITIKTDSYLSLYFHPWEFTDISAFPLPNFIKKHSGDAMLSRLENYLIWLKTQGKFITFSEFLNIYKK